MTKKELIIESEKSNDDIEICKILQKEDGIIRFAINENLQSPESHLIKSTDSEIINRFLSKEQIPFSLYNIVTHSLPLHDICFVGKDVLWQSFLICYATHRPLVLSPDVIALVINQKITSIIRDNPEIYRGKFVDFEGIKELIVESETDLFDNRTDWKRLFDDIYSQIKKNTTLTDVSTWVNDYSTTEDNERIASIATLMGTVESYYQYTIRHYICGIPEITLLGTSDDWEKLLNNLEHLKTFGLKTWYSWLRPVIKEFVRTAQGFPNIKFWGKTVMDYSDEFNIGKSCSPYREETKITGWCRVLFPRFHNGRIDFNCSTNFTSHSSEVLRVGFNYERISSYATSTFPMELWAGIFGVVENESTNALIPKIGWMIRKSDVESENLARLIKQDEYKGIHLDICEIPDILKRLDHINSLTLRFEKNVTIPSWFYDLNIETLVIYGKTDRETRKLLKTKFANVKVYASD